MERVYLDHTATTPMDERVLEAMLPYFGGTFGNASSVHWFGRQAKDALERSRRVIADAIGAEPGELFFTSGGTEADNHAVRGVASAARKKTNRPHMITTNAEHHAVLEPCSQIAIEGCDVTFLPVNGDGLVSPGDVGNALTDSSSLVSVMTANNEVGSISPIRGIADLCRDHGVPLHSDAVQALGKIPLDVTELGVDLMSLSAHKIYGPKGIGALYVKRGTDFHPILQGGGQERGRRPGTESVPLAVGFAKAVELALSDMDEETLRLTGLRDELQHLLTTRFTEAVVNGHPTDRLPHILNISFDSSKIDIDGEMLLYNMDLGGIAVASGSACTSGSVHPSHVLLAMGRDVRTAAASIRFAFGRSNTSQDVIRAADVLTGAIRRMRAGDHVRL